MVPILPYEECVISVVYYICDSTLASSAFHSEHNNQTQASLWSATRHFFPS